MARVTMGKVIDPHRGQRPAGGPDSSPRHRRRVLGPSVPEPACKMLPGSPHENSGKRCSMTRPRAIESSVQKKVGARPRRAVCASCTVERYTKMTPDREKILVATQQLFGGRFPDMQMSCPDEVKLKPDHALRSAPAPSTTIGSRLSSRPATTERCRWTSRSRKGSSRCRPRRSASRVT
jgi:hypothetical protein